MISPNGAFQCEEPDFTLRSIPDYVTFRVKRAHLSRSQVFQDMFACCDLQTGGLVEDQVLNIAESARVVVLLLNLLHWPPKPVTAFVPPVGDNTIVHDAVDERKIIPLPLIEQLLSLADKYMLSSDITEALHSHILAQARTSPLHVYGLASALRLPYIASKASAYLMDPPLDTYTLEEIQENVPDLEAYHQLMRLQALRSRRLKEVLVHEELFPHGYGRCDGHDKKAVLVWEQRKQRIAWRIHAGSDVASEMKEVMQSYEGCKTCSKAGEAALEMLRYKCNKCPKRIDQLPS